MMKKLTFAALCLVAGPAAGQDGALGDAHKLREAGRPAEALAAYRRVAESADATPHDRGGAALWIAHLLREQGRRDEALAAYRALARLKDAHPHDRGGAQLWVAHLLREAGRAGDAREAYAAAAGMPGAHPHDRGGALVWLGALQADAKEAVTARDVLTAAPALKGLHENDAARARALLAKLPAPAPSDREASESARQSGLAADAKGERDAAMASFVLALERAGTPTQAARARNQIAFKWRCLDRPEEARVLLRISLEAAGADDASKTEAQYLLAHSWIDQHNWGEAYPAWERLLEMPALWDGARADAYLIVGNGKLELKKHSEARDVFQKCVDFPKAEPRQKWEAQAGIARSFREENNIPAAVAALEALLRMDGLDAGRRSAAEEQLKELRQGKQ